MHLETLVHETARDLVAGPLRGVVVAVFRGDETATAGAVHAGTGGAGEDLPDEHTLFEIGSLTKTFTSSVLLRRVSAGTLAFDRPVRDLLPGGRPVPERDGRAITLVDLATHTSGLPRLPRGAMPRALLPMSDPYARYTTDRLLDGLARTRLKSVPGTKVLYSNLGGGLLGLALAEHAGTDYATLVARAITEPLGMPDTVVTPGPAHAGRVAQGHTRSGKPATPWNLAALVGAGGLRSTSADLFTFLRAHLDDGPEVEGLRLGTGARRPMREQVWMQPGWVAADHGFPVLMHNGGTGGFASFAGLATGRNTGVVILANGTHDVTGEGMKILNALVGAPE